MSKKILPFKKLKGTHRRSMMEVKPGKDSVKIKLTGQYLDEFKDAVKLYMNVMYEDASMYEADSIMSYIYNRMEGLE